MTKNNGSIRMNPDTHIDINEHLKQEGCIVSRRPDTTGSVGGMPVGATVSSDFFEDLNKQTLASLS